MVVELLPNQACKVKGIIKVRAKHVILSRDISYLSKTFRAWNLGDQAKEKTWQSNGYRIWESTIDEDEKMMSKPRVFGAMKKL
jgi:hypothetical protein